MASKKQITPKTTQNDKRARQTRMYQIIGVVISVIVVLSMVLSSLQF